MNSTLTKPSLNSQYGANPLLKKLSLKKPGGASLSLNNIKTEQENKTEASVAEEKPANPFAKPLSFDKFREKMNSNSEPTEKKPTEETETVAEVETTESANEDVSENTPEPENNAEINTESSAEVNTETVTNESVETAENVSSEAELDTSEVVTNDETPIESVVDNIETTTTEDAAIANEEATEPAPKKKRTRRSKAQVEADKLCPEENEKTEAIQCDEVATVVVEAKNNSTVSFSEALNEFASFSGDADWIEYKNDIEKAYEAIEITSDINSAMLVGIINQLSNLRDRIWNQHQYYKNQYDQLSSKEPEGVIERFKRINVNESANNDMARKKAGIAACMNYKTDNGETINLYDLLDEVRARYYFLNAIMSNIEFKKNLLITISSALKIENSLAG